jgi:hypothetical protein
MTERFSRQGVMESERGPTLAMRTWRVNRPEMVIKCVCAACNNEWMSQHQGRCKPIFESLWADGNHELELLDRRALVSWATMTSMVLQNLDEPENRLFSEEERTVFWKTNAIPSYMGIWIAHCDGFTSMHTEGRSMQTGPPESPQPARGNAITMATGSVGIQVVKVTLDPLARRPRSMTVGQGFGDWENIALQLWPLKGDPMTWPPPRAIRSGDELEIFAGGSVAEAIQVWATWLFRSSGSETLSWNWLQDTHRSQSMRACNSARCVQRGGELHRTPSARN